MWDKIQTCPTAKNVISMLILIRLLQALKPYRWQLAALIVLVFGVTATLLVAPALIRRAIDEGLAQRDVNALAQVALLIIGVGALRALLGLARRYTAE